MNVIGNVNCPKGILLPFDTSLLLLTVTSSNSLILPIFIYKNFPSTILRTTRIRAWGWSPILQLGRMEFLCSYRFRARLMEMGNLKFHYYFFGS